MKIALINNNVVENIIVSDLEFAETLSYDHVMIADESVAIGWLLVENELVKPAEPHVTLRPKLVIVSTQSSNIETTIISDSFDEVTCFEGTTITFTTELRNPFDESVIPLTQMFRMPVKSRDNREFLVLVNMINGVASVPITFNNSGVWSATEETLNSNLNEEEKISFTGIKVFVVQS